MVLISTFNNQDLIGNIYQDGQKYIISGKVNKQGVSTINYKAAAPADLRLSYSGSGLPFHSPEQAYDNSVNIGKATINELGEFSFELCNPNSYYVNQGVKLIRPHVHICLSGETIQPKSLDLKLGPGIPNRSLRHLDGRPDRSYGR